MSPSRLLRTARAAVVPEGLLLGAAVVLLEWNVLGDSAAAVAGFAPPSVIAAGLLLAWRFHRGRVLLALVTLGLAVTAIAVTEAGSSQALVVHQAMGVLLPLNLAGLALLPERGLATPSGLLRWSAVALQVLVVLALAYPTPAPAADMLLRGVAPDTAWHGSRLHSAALIAFGGGSAVLLGNAALRPNATARGFLWATVGAFLALEATTATAGVLYLTAGALILAVAVIEASYFMAFRDGLTGLPGRRAFDEALLRLRGRYTVAMVDVDRFKRVNDRYGHDVGDQVLRMVASRLERVSGGGRAYRYGGEEFAVLFAGKGTDDALPHLEGLREAVEAEPFALRGADRPKETPERPRRSKAKKKSLTVTVSIGAAQPTDRNTPAVDVVRAADQALYRAKQAGRNRVKS
ncbi:MAG: GGDEF domain-containing protein [Gemmatimonadales bacterium]